MLEERRLEFPFELHRWFDLIRTDTAIDAMAKVGFTITKDDYLYPLPKTEVDLINNPLTFLKIRGIINMKRCILVMAVFAAITTFGQTLKNGKRGIWIFIILIQDVVIVLFVFFQMVQLY